MIQTTLKYFHSISYGLISGILLALSWIPFEFTLPIFFAFVPLLILHEKKTTGEKQATYFLINTYLALLIWNFSTGWWLFNFSFITGLLINMINPLIFMLPFVAYKILRYKLNTFYSGLGLVFLFLALEWLHLTWGFSFPLLNLGNSLASVPLIIQWYKWVGAGFGSFWVLLINLFIFQVWLNRKAKVFLFALISTTLIPTGISLILYFTPNNYEDNPIEIVVVHTNLDARTEKYVLSKSQILNKHLELTKKGVSYNTEYVIWPESAIPDGGWLEDIDLSEEMAECRKFLKNYPNLKIITGVILTELAQSNNSSGQIPLQIPGSKLKYFTYTGGVQVSSRSMTIPFRSKKRLVPVEEKTPYNINYIRQFIPPLGGFSFNTKDNDQPIFHSQKASVSYQICYETAYSENFTDAVNKGAELIFIGLNESWYSSKLGARHFLNLSIIRAIEVGRYIARSSNDGISAFINPRGLITKQASASHPEVLKDLLVPIRTKTIFTRLGNFIYPTSLILGISVLIIAIFKPRNIN